MFVDVALKLVISLTAQTSNSERPHTHPILTVTLFQIVFRFVVILFLSLEILFQIVDFLRKYPSVVVIHPRLYQQRN